MKLKDIQTSLFALTILGAMSYLWFTPTGITSAPDITVSTIRGEKIRLSSLQGRPLLVTFWATTCPGCIKEMPHLVELYKELAPKGFEIIGIAMPYDPPNQVIALTEKRQLPYPIALDITGEAARAFGDVRLTPSSFLIAPDGSVAHQKVGEMDIPKLRTLIIDMLAQSNLPHAVRTN